MTEDDQLEPAYGPEQRYRTRDDQVDIERLRLSMLAEARDPKTFGLLSRVEIAEGMHCLEVGAGTGTVSAWMADKVGASGRVMSTDIDLQFHAEMPANVILREHDIESDSLPREHFDIVHARAVLQHVPSRDEVVGKLVEALKPGGWLIVEDTSLLGFRQQRLPEPYRTIHQIMTEEGLNDWRDSNFGIQVLSRMREIGLVDLDVVGDVWAMHPHEPSGEWWYLAFERAIPYMVAAGVANEADCSSALEQVRSEDFVMMSPAWLATLGRKPR
ncbi:MAG: methyltransferase domain-containing protein [Acidimicrobiaceae bacterium]|nr:methyltransferase domain-containing protein [Acidimicrobiaceae bacterium]